MSISNTDIAKLWGLAGGCCSAPGCQQDCIPFLDPKAPTLIGEMAHVIPKSKDGPRGDGVNEGDDTYDNRILLCPTCHTKVDKAANMYPPEVLLQWKREHEVLIKASRKTPHFGSIEELVQAIARYLQENHHIWKQFGPDSELAQNNPYSAGSRLWVFQKLSTIVPNNNRIAQLLETHKHLVSSGDWPVCVEFIQHASAFEQNAYNRMDSDAVPRFPNAFGEFITQLNKEKT